MLTYQISRAPDRKKVKCVTKFIKVAKELREIHNYHSLFSLIFGLSDSAVAPFLKKVASKHLKVSYINDVFLP
jgi:hypothetical protein